MLKTPMEDATPNEKYIEYREYPNADEDAPIVTKLVRPPSLFTDVIKTQLMSFNRMWQHHWASSVCSMLYIDKSLRRLRMRVCMQRIKTILDG